MFKNLYTQADFLNLTSDDVEKIKEILDIDLPDEVDEYEYLYENINMFEGNIEANNILSKKILAGQLSVKWFKFDYNETFTREVLIEKLESKDLGFNINALDRLKADIKDDIISIIKDNNIYTLKLFISDGYNRVTNGIQSRREPRVKSVIVNIDIDNCWVEVRTNEDRCKKIIRILERKVGLVELKGVLILNNYNDDINIFKDNLIDGFYLNYKAAPSEITELSEDDGRAIATIIKSIDEYFENKDNKKLIENLEKIDYDTTGLTLSSILLAGIDNMGMKIRNDSEKDMSKQSLYNILKDDLIEDSSYIRFSIVPDGVKYTMQVGMKSNSIVFRTSVTEDVISYIRGKIL